MNLCRLHVNTFGIWNDLRLDGFSAGVNVIHGPVHSGKSTLLDFIRAVFYGFDDTDRRRHLPAGMPHGGGAVEVTHAQRRHVLCRHNDQSPQGTLRIETIGSEPGPREPLRELFTRIDPALFQRVFTISFRRPQQTEGLVREAALLGFESANDRSAEHRLSAQLVQLQRQREALKMPADGSVPLSLPLRVPPGRRDLLTTPADGSVPLAELAEQRDRLVAEIDELVAGEHLRSEMAIRDRQSVNGQIERCHFELAELGQQMTTLDGEIEQFTQRKQSLRQRIDELGRGETTPLVPLDQLTALDSQIARWRAVLADVAKRRAQLRQMLVDWAVGHSHDDQHGPLATRAAIQALQQQVQTLETELTELYRSSTTRCACRDAYARLTPVLHAIRDHVATIEVQYEQQHAELRRSAVESELRQLRRCQAEVTRYIKGLLDWRQRVLAEPATVPAPRRLSLSSEKGLCGCGHQHTIADVRHETTPTELQRELSAVTARLDELSRQYSDLESRRHSLQSTRDGLIVQRDQLKSAISGGTADAELARKQDELQCVERRLQLAEQQRQSLNEQIASLTRELESQRQRLRRPSVLDEASGLLSRMTRGEFVELSHYDATGGLQVVNRNGRAVRFDVLDRSTLDLAHLSVCLALAAALRRRGSTPPMLIDDVFAHVELHYAEPLAKVLVDQSASGQQFVLLTDCEDITTVLRDAPAVIHRLPERIVAREIAPSFALPMTVRETAWDAEEFPGELTDRALVGAASGEWDWGHDGRFTEAWHPTLSAGPVGPRTESNGASHSTNQSHFYLRPSSAIADVPEVDAETAAFLRSRGVQTVADLLALDPAEFNRSSGHSPLTAARLAHHQSVARLLCGIRHLRPYDARILVGSGITSPGQFHEMDFNQVVSRIDRFVQTDEGQRVVSSGDDFELTRVASWLRGVREQRSRQDEHPHESQRAERPTHTSQRTGAQHANGKHEGTARDGTARDGRHRSSRTPREARSGREENRGPRPQLAVLDDDAHPTPRVNHSTSRVHETGSETDRPARFYLHRSSPVVDAPSIGPSTAERLAKIGVVTVDDLLTASADDIAARLRSRRIKAETVRQWQAQAKLVCCVPHLRGHDAQILVACGYTSVEQLDGLSPHQLYAQVQPFVDSKEGERIVRSGKKPDLEEVTEWLASVQQTRPLSAA